MAWSTPKTDWTASDRFNAVDYNRWKNNLLYLKEFSLELFEDYSLVTLYDDKTRTFVPLASEMNALETAISQINEHTYNFDIGEGRVNVTNQHTLNYEDVNRIESTTLKIYRTLQCQKNIQHHLAFRLGNTRTFDVPRV